MTVGGFGGRFWRGGWSRVGARVPAAGEDASDRQPPAGARTSPLARSGAERRPPFYAVAVREDPLVDWDEWERLLRTRGVQIDRPRGSDHPRYPGWVYPLDYGFVPGTLAPDEHEVDAFCGSADNGLTAVLVVRHGGHEELKLLWNVTKEEAEAARDFLRPLPYVALVWRP